MTPILARSATSPTPPSSSSREFCNAMPPMPTTRHSSTSSKTLLPISKKENADATNRQNHHTDCREACRLRGPGSHIQTDPIRATSRVALAPEQERLWTDAQQPPAPTRLPL